MRQEWTPDRVIAAIQARHRRGLPLRGIQVADRNLYMAAVRRFGSWHAALSAAGFPSKPPHKWSRQRILDAIRDRDRQGHGLADIRSDDVRLVAAARRYFGSWAAALQAAGVPVEKREPTRRAAVIAAIQAHLDRGMSMTRVWKEDKSLYHAARKEFGCWHRALAAVGVESKPRRKWSKAVVIEAIQERKEQGLNLVGREDSRLAAAGEKYFGTWRQAVRAAGFELTHRRQWTCERVKHVLQAWKREHGSMTKVWKNAQGLYAVAKQYFGNWEKALVAAGIKPLRQQWNRQRVIDLIREGLSRGDSLATIWSSPGLQSAAAGYFGGRRKALLAAGFPSPELRHWTKGIVVEAIRHRHQQGLPMINVGRWDSALLSAAHRHYGSWTKAMAAAGLESCQRKWSEQRMLAWVRSWYRLPKDQRPKRDVNLYAATLRRFGNARSAMLAAGIDPDQNKWSEQRVIDAIQDRYVKGLPMKYVRCEDLALISAAKRFFGSWHKAMQAAGVLNAED